LTPQRRPASFHLQLQASGSDPEQQRELADGADLSNHTNDVETSVKPEAKSENAVIIERFKARKAFERERKDSSIGYMFPTFLAGFFAFLLAYSERPGHVAVVPGLFILFFIPSYLRYYGIDEVRWMLINGALSVFAMYSDVGWFLSYFFFGTSVSDYHWYVHIVPFTYIVIFTFLLRQWLIDLFDAREDEKRKELVGRYYAWGSFVLHSALLLWRRVG